MCLWGLIAARISGDTGPLNIFSTLDISRTPEEFTAILDNLNKPEKFSAYVQDFEILERFPAHLH
jgi:hypothetical protein